MHYMSGNDVRLRSCRERLLNLSSSQQIVEEIT